MELRQLRYFTVVAKLGSISQAAQELHIAQPALTRQIQKLEEDVGVILLERTGRGVKPTDAGTQFLIDAEKLLDDAITARQRAVRASRGECGTLSLALPVIQNAAPSITGLLKRFKKEAPHVGITLHHLISEVQLAMIAQGQLDAGFLLFRPQNDPLFDGVPVFKERMLFAYPAEWTWSENKKPEYLRDLQDLDFIWIFMQAGVLSLSGRKPAMALLRLFCRSAEHHTRAISLITSSFIDSGATVRKDIVIPASLYFLTFFTT
ncbi:LysR family transcriptional regulator [Atlantibacter hermannii]|uniref:LysR family transcriptional regulator n=1 Tax=Atlantibacter hermannii TaxID=565 RepID=UPI003D6D9CF6